MVMGENPFINHSYWAVLRWNKSLMKVCVKDVFVIKIDINLLSFLIFHLFYFKFDEI